MKILEIKNGVNKGRWFRITEKIIENKCEFNIEIDRGNSESFKFFTCFSIDFYDGCIEDTINKIENGE